MRLPLRIPLNKNIYCLVKHITKRQKWSIHGGGGFFFQVFIYMVRKHNYFSKISMPHSERICVAKSNNKIKQPKRFNMLYYTHFTKR